MSSLPLAVARSRRLPARVLGIGALVALGWWAVPQLAAAQLPDSLGWRTDFSKASVALDEIRSGGPPKDGIPPIDRPRFDDVASAVIAARLGTKDPEVRQAIGRMLNELYWHRLQASTGFPYGAEARPEVDEPDPCPPCGMAMPSIRARTFLGFFSGR